MESLKILLNHWMILTLGVVLSYTIVQLVRKIFSGVDEEMWGNNYAREEFIVKNK
jgi:hypothetical protein